VTYEQICEAWIRYSRPGLTDPVEINQAARAFWGSDPSGHVFHVSTAHEIMIMAGVLPEEHADTKCVGATEHDRVEVCLVFGQVVRSACRRCGRFWLHKLNLDRQIGPEELLRELNGHKEVQ
jgi:hypothetical protein